MDLLLDACDLYTWWSLWIIYMMQFVIYRVIKFVDLLLDACDSYTWWSSWIIYMMQFVNFRVIKLMTYYRQKTMGALRLPSCSIIMYDICNIISSSYVNVLQCVAVCCSVLQVCCKDIFIVISSSYVNVLQCVVVWCSVLQCVAVCCSVLQGKNWQWRSTLVSWKCVALRCSVF